MPDDNTLKFEPKPKTAGEVSRIEPPPAPSTPLSNRRREFVEAGLRSWQEEAQRADDNAREIERLTALLAQRDDRVAAVERELEDVRATTANAVSEMSIRMSGLQSERDQAVADRADLEALFALLRVAIDRHALPPPVRKPKTGAAGGGRT